MKKYSHLYPDNDGNPDKTKVEFDINENIVFITVINKSDRKLIGYVEKENNKLIYYKINDSPVAISYYYLIPELKIWIKDYFSMRVISFPRIFLNSSRALSDSGLWSKLEKLFLTEDDTNNIELTQYTMLSLLSGTAIFSYASIESYVNETLTAKLGLDKFNEIDNCKNTKSLKEKVKKLCDILNFKNKIQNQDIWSDFIILEEIRNSFVHYKKGNLFDLLYKYNNRISPLFLVNTGVKVLKFLFDGQFIQPEEYLIDNHFKFTDIEVYFSN